MTFRVYSMVIDNAKWERFFKIFEGLAPEDRLMVGALYHGRLKLQRDARCEVCYEEVMETCLRTLGHLGPIPVMGDGALEYEDAMTGNEIVANLTSARGT